MLNLCTPATIYLILAAIGLFLGGWKAFSIIHLFVILLWTFILNFICKKGYAVVSWILVLLPLIYIFGMVVMANKMIASISHQ
jgi:hypothetical protein